MAAEPYEQSLGDEEDSLETGIFESWNLRLQMRRGGSHKM